MRCSAVFWLIAIKGFGKATKLAFLLVKVKKRRKRIYAADVSLISLMMLPLYCCDPPAPAIRRRKILARCLADAPRCPIVRPGRHARNCTAMPAR